MAGNIPATIGGTLAPFFFGIYLGLFLLVKWAIERAEAKR